MKIDEWRNLEEYIKYRAETDAARAGHAYTAQRAAASRTLQYIREFTILSNMVWDEV